MVRRKRRSKSLLVIATLGVLLTISLGGSLTKYADSHEEPKSVGLRFKAKTGSEHHSFVMSSHYQSFEAKPTFETNGQLVQPEKIAVKKRTTSDDEMLVKGSAGHAVFLINHDKSDRHSLVYDIHLSQTALDPTVPLEYSYAVVEKDTAKQKKVKQVAQWSDFETLKSELSKSHAVAKEKEHHVYVFWRWDQDAHKKESKQDLASGVTIRATTHLKAFH